jgi:Mg/Co/Ni transporter MgtE
MEKVLALINLQKQQKVLADKVKQAKEDVIKFMTEQKLNKVSLKESPDDVCKVFSELKLVERPKTKAKTQEEKLDKIDEMLDKEEVSAEDILEVLKPEPVEDEVNYSLSFVKLKAPKPQKPKKVVKFAE